MTTNEERITASEWYECLKHEARASLILFYGIDEPTEKEIFTGERRLRTGEKKDENCRRIY